MKADEHIPQIKALIASPLIKQYLIGITSKSTVRRKSYLSVGFPFYYVLETGLSKEEALAIEKELFNKLITDRVTYKKYHVEKRNKPYRPSTGGKSGDYYEVYVAAYGT